VPASLLVSVQSFGGLLQHGEQGRSLGRLVHSRIIATCITVTFSACRGFAAPAMLQRTPDWTGKPGLTFLEGTVAVMEHLHMQLPVVGSLHLCMPWHAIPCLLGESLCLLQRLLFNAPAW
jgi:hypothetical protein